MEGRCRPAAAASPAHMEGSAEEAAREVVEVAEDSVAGPMEVGEGEARVRAAVLMEEVEAAVRAQAAGVQAEARVEAAATASALSPTWIHQLCLGAPRSHQRTWDNQDGAKPHQRSVLFFFPSPPMLGAPHLARFWRDVGYHRSRL